MDVSGVRGDTTLLGTYPFLTTSDDYRNSMVICNMIPTKDADKVASLNVLHPMGHTNR